MRSPISLKSFFYIPAPALMVSGLAFFGLSACGGDDVASPDVPTSVNSGTTPGSSTDIDIPESLGGSATTMSSSSSAPASTTSSSSGEGGKPTPKSSATADWMPVSSAKTETVSSDEVLAEAKKVVNGSCAPTSEEIEKGGMATWAFYRQDGDVFDQIMSPFVWTFDDGKVLKGNGMDKVNKTYESSGIYKATLNVDGNDIECAPLRVQGIPITIKSCKAAKNSVNAGETISWTVVAESESEITGYSWKSSDADVAGSGTSATMVATGEMHKKTVSATVTVENKDKTSQDYSCEPVSVIDPNQVDVVIAHTTADEKKAFTAGQTMVAQYPSNAVNCQMICSAQGNGVILDIDGEEYTIDYSANISPKGCKDGAAAGTKISVKASMQVLCYVAY